MKFKASSRMFTFKFFYCARSHLFSHAHQAFVHFPKCTFSQLVLESNIWSGNFRAVSNFHGELKLQEQCNRELLFQTLDHWITLSKNSSQITSPLFCFDLHIGRNFKQTANINTAAKNKGKTITNTKSLMNLSVSWKKANAYHKQITWSINLSRTRVLVNLCLQ